MHPPIFILISACFLVQVITIRAQTCYFPDGSESPRDTPCRAPASGQASACCPYLDVCLDNSLCLAQTGNEVVIRGTCTDRTWQSSDCPRYCQDGTFFCLSLSRQCAGNARVSPLSRPFRQCQKLCRNKNLWTHAYPYLLVHTSYGVTIYPFQDDTSFCCGPGNSSTNACVDSTLGLTAPFAVPAGRVIFNRTSGSTSPNISDTSTITVLPTAVSSTTTTTASTGSAICTNSPPSSTDSAKVGYLEVGIPLGLGLLATLGLLWRERSRTLGARRDAQAWREKYLDRRRENPGILIGSEGQVHELGCESWKPAEIDGCLVQEAAGM